MCSGRVSSSCSASDTRRVNPVTKPFQPELCFQAKQKSDDFFFSATCAKMAD